MESTSIHWLTQEGPAPKSGVEPFCICRVLFPLFDFQTQKFLKELFKLHIAAEVFPKQALRRGANFLRSKLIFRDMAECLPDSSRAFCQTETGFGSRTFRSVGKNTLVKSWTLRNFYSILNQILEEVQVSAADVTHAGPNMLTKLGAGLIHGGIMNSYTIECYAGHRWVC